MMEKVEGPDNEEKKKELEKSIEREAPVQVEAQKMLKQWEEGDEKVVGLWKMMNSWVYKGFDETYDRLGVCFDKIYYESDTYKLGKSLVLEGLEKKIF